MSDEHAPLVDEVVTRLRSDGAVLFEWRCTPIDLAALAVGRLYLEGMLESADAARTIEITSNERGEIEITTEADLSPRQITHSRVQAKLPDSEGFADLFRALFAGADERHPDGGVHAAALATNDAIAFQAEDVGRHNAVDKVIGMALLANADPSQYGMLVSSRVSGEIARKASRAGVAWLASRSIPTTLAVATARTAGMALIGRAAGKGAFFYS